VAVCPVDYSVVLCTHNRGPVLREALASHEALEIPDGVTSEIVVVDNASTDDTNAVVREFARTASRPVHYVLEPRLGHARALNTGIARSTGRIVAFTDDDAFPEPGWLAAMHHAFGREDVDWVFGPISPIWQREPPAWYGPATRHLFAVLDYGSDPFVVRDTAYPFYGINHASRREALERLGGFSEDLGAVGGRGGMGNDEDLFQRALAASLRVMYAPDVRVRHLIAPARCEKRYHRANAWPFSQVYFEHVRNTKPPGPTLLGLPRWFYRKAVDHGAGWAVNTLKGDRSRAFHSELQARRFMSLIVRAMQHRWRA
jgi:GT2 family glycosyltransferase